MKFAILGIIERHVACNNASLREFARAGAGHYSKGPSMDTQVERRRPDRHLIALRLMRRIAIFALVASGQIRLRKIGFVMEPKPT